MTKQEIVAKGIATAEGYYAPGPHNGHSLPYSLNNPGDLEASSVPYNGKVQGKCQFATADDGWLALGRELNLIATGHSHVYAPSRTLQQFASIWTGGDNPSAWLTNMLGVCNANGLTLTGESTLADALCNG